MVRRYEEPIDVRTPALQPAGGGGLPWAGERPGPAGEEPDAFLWRGRFYLVREVIDHWQERRAWWRDAGGDGLPDAPTADDRAGENRAGEGRGASAVPSTERRVWRVAASPGRHARTGVYDLGADGEPARWLLLRAHD